MGDAEHAPQQPDAAAFPVERTARPREICSAPSAVHSVDEGGAHGRAGDGSSAAHTQKPDAGGGPDEPQHHSDQEDPDAYDVVYLNRLLDYAGEDGIAMKETAPLVAQSAQAHSPLVTAGDAARGAGGLGSSRAALPPQRPRSSTSHSAHPKPGPAPANEPARAAHAHRSGSEWRPAADVVDEPAAAAALLDTNAGLRGKKLQAMPGAMLRRRPASARQDPLGEKLVRLCLPVPYCHTCHRCGGLAPALLDAWSRAAVAWCCLPRGCARIHRYASRDEVGECMTNRRHVCARRMFMCTWLPIRCAIRCWPRKERQKRLLRASRPRARLLLWRVPKPGFLAGDHQLPRLAIHLGQGHMGTAPNAAWHRDQPPPWRA